MYRDTASSDFDRARRKAFWRRVLTWIKGDSNELLPFGKFRENLPFKGQHYLGLREVPVDQIVGSLGRFKDFDREFLPVQSVTKDRWINIDLAHYDDIILPPVDLYKMGDIYFVKDGNHRVSVARERQQKFMDAYVTEIDIPVPLSVETKIEDLTVKQEYAEFLEKTQLEKLNPDAKFETKITGQYKRLLEHIDVHRWYLGEQRVDEVPYDESVESWYENIYYPLIDALRYQEIFDEFPEIAELDMYLWMMEYQSYLRDLYRYRENIDSGEITAAKIEKGVKAEAGKLIVRGHPLPPVKKLVNSLNRAAWVEDLILYQERAAFFRQTKLNELRPGVKFETQFLGNYEKLLEHIAVHRWYLGEHRGEEVPYIDAVLSWCDTVYLPLISIIQEQLNLNKFPERTETDLYLWIITRQWYLSQVLGSAST
ncbi:MAG: hypothetical protein ACXAB7_22345, partial [Candidatus Kariarchaeaceae archaeon]